MIKHLRALYLTLYTYLALGLLFLIFVLGFFFPLLLLMGKALFIAFIFTMAIDLSLLFANKNRGVKGNRLTAQRFSNGDANEVTLTVVNHYPFSVQIDVIDEIPAQFQNRSFMKKLNLTPDKEEVWNYVLRPVERGEYKFGALNLFVKTPISLVSRRFRFAVDQMVKVYPSFIEMRKFEMMAISNRLEEVGIKKIRRVGHQMEFDQIREYIKGDDIRTINWKATARRQNLMVNQYQEEKSQQVFSIIDMGRTMQMPFNGVTLLDYAINSSLVLSNIAMLKHDRAGLITFNERIQSFVPAQRTGKHLQTIMEVLYNQQTSYLEHNLEALYALVRRKVSHRSLLFFYTNFESFVSAKRQLAFLQSLAKEHLVVVVFFENSEIVNSLEARAEDIESIYTKTIAEKFVYDKRLIVKELNRKGIHSVLSEPGALSVNSINKYLELKARGLL